MNLGVLRQSINDTAWHYVSGYRVKKMKDVYGREIEYLRLSVTQNCNLRCIYCAPEDCRADNTKCGSILSPKEMGTVVKALAGLGIKKVRITGGEPLLRPDIYEIVSHISSITGIDDISMTTNGICLKKAARKLKESGLMRLNISIDSLRKEKFAYLTGGGNIEDVLDGIKTALNEGLSPVRLNTVLIKGVNDDEVDDFIALTENLPLDVRFIELMPIGNFGEDNADRIVYNDSIIEKRPWLIPCDVENKGHPARYYRIEGFKGRVGFISPMSHKFCRYCNRIRLTCDGKLLPCLGSNEEINILDVLRNKPDELVDILSKSIYEKPKGHNFENKSSSKRSMKMIGG